MGPRQWRRAGICFEASSDLNTTVSHAQTVSLPGIAVRRTASLPLAYDPAIHLLEKSILRRLMDARVKPAHDGRVSGSSPAPPPASRCRGGKSLRAIGCDRYPRSRG